MILIGISWLLFWLLVEVLNVNITMAALITGAVFIVLGLVQGEQPFPFSVKRRLP